MNGKDAEQERLTTDINTIPPSPYTEPRKTSINKTKSPVEDEILVSTDKKKKNSAKSSINFLYNSRKKTVLGRGALNWAKLAAFYTIFYFCLGCFFCGLLYIFALILDRNVPRYYNQDSTMAVRTTATVVGMGFRPQPVVDDSLIRITNNAHQQKRIASSLRLYRDVFLVQRSDAKTEECSDEEPASELPLGTACLFNWFHIVNSEDHPCSDNNMYGFKKEEPCVLVKLNKVYGWTPSPGPIPFNIKKLQNNFSNRTIPDPDVFITCGGSNPADNDVLTDMIYYSMDNPSGSTKYGTVPNYFFPYRNARDHVQPFVLVQFKNLPLDRLISVTCKAWAPGMEHDPRAMRGMVAFQLYRSHENIESNEDLQLEKNKNF